MMKAIRSVKAALYPCFCVLYASVAESNPVVDVTLGARAEYHDNILLTRNDKKEDIAEIASASVQASNKSSTYDLDVDYTAEHWAYQHGNVNNQNTIAGHAGIDVRLVPRYLDFVFDHQLSELLSSRTAADTVQNRQRRSVITTGFDGYAHFSPVDSLKLSPRKIIVDYQDNNQSDSKRSELTASWEHLLRPRTSLFVDVSGGNVQFDQNNNDYNFLSEKIGFRGSSAHLGYSMDVGRSEFRPSHYPNMSGFTSGVSLEYQGNAVTWGGIFVQDMTDTSLGLSSVQLNQPNLSTQDSSAGVDILKTQQLDLYARARLFEHSSLRLGAGYVSEDYKNTPQDDKLHYVQLDYDYDLTSRLTLGVGLRYADTRLLDDPARTRNKDVTPLLKAIYSYTRHLKIETQLSVARRQSNVDTSEYVDRRAIVGVTYQF